MRTSLIILLVAMTLNAAANLLMKHSANLAGAEASLSEKLFSPAGLWLGLGLAALVAASAWIAWLLLPLPTTAVTLVLAGLVGALIYSLPPVSAMRHGWGEPLNAVLGGLLLPLAGVAVIAGGVDLADVLAFLPFSLVVLASVMATAWPDRSADAATGKATMPVRLRPGTLRRIHLAVSVGFVLAAGAAAIAAAAPLALAGLLVVPALVIGTLGYTRRESPWPNVVAMVGLALVLVVAHGLSLPEGPWSCVSPTPTAWPSSTCGRPAWAVRRPLASSSGWPGWTSASCAARWPTTRPASPSGSTSTTRPWCGRVSSTS